MAQKSKTKPAVKAKVKISKAAAKYLQSPGQIGTGVIPVTPPLSSADARKQIRGFQTNHIASTQETIVFDVIGRVFDLDIEKRQAAARRLAGARPKPTTTADFTRAMKR